MIDKNDKILVTTDGWFFAPDGNSYKAAWGSVHIFDSENILGIKTNSKSTNWYITLGSGDRQILIAGCQVHYAIKCGRPDISKGYTRKIEHNGELSEVVDNNVIYLAE